MKRLFFINYVLLKNNIWTLITFELLYKVLGILLVIPAAGGLFSLARNLSGYTYITSANLLSFIFSPESLVFLLIAAFLISIYVLFEVFTFVVIFEASYVGYLISMWQAVRKAINKLKKMIYPQNYIMILFMFVIIPFCGFTAISSLFMTISMPDFVMDFIETRAWAALMYGTAYVFACYFAVKWIFGIQFFVLRDCSSKEARHQARLLVKGRNLQAVLYGVFYNIVIFALGSLLSFITISVVKIISSAGQISMLISAGGGLMLFVYIIVACLMVPLAYSLVASLYYLFCEKKSFTLNIQIRKKPSISLFRRNFILSVLGVLILLCSFTFKMVAEDHVYGDIDLSPQTMITAHRGSTRSAPENTLSALDFAIKSQADYAEIDVQETKDGVIILAHDDNFKRIAGVNKNVWDLTYAEISQFDVGKWFSPEFAGERVATLDEVIKYTENKINLIIEIKISGHEKDTVGYVLDIVKENDAINRCIIASLDYEVLQKAKAYNSQVRTSYLLSLAAGDISNLQAADILCVEATFITKKMVDSVHASGKKIYAWTVNSEDTMKRLINYGVDNIVTDNPQKARDLSLQLTSNPMFSYLFRFT
jgi:glycerophosphoryl diester phosphodiesterase